MNSTELQVIENISDLNSLKVNWDNLYSQNSYRSLDAHINRFQTVMDAFSSRNPFVVVVKKSGSLKAILAGHLSFNNSKAWIGYWRFNLPKLRTWNIIYGGIINGTNSDFITDLPAILKKIRKKYKLDSVTMNHVPEPVYKCLKGNVHSITRKEVHWTMNMMENLDSFYKKFSSKHRGAIKSHIRKAEKLPDFEVRTLTDQRDLNELIEDAEKVSRKTYQYALNAGLNDMDVIKKLYADSMENGWLDLNIAYVEKEPVAFQVGHIINETYHLDSIGCDPAYGNSRIGTVLFIKVLDRITGKTELKTMDFGFGDAEYKQRFGDNRWQEISFEIYSLSMKSVYVLTLRTILSSTDRVLKFLMEKMGITAQIKKIWRRVLRAE